MLPSVGTIMALMVLLTTFLQIVNVQAQACRAETVDDKFIWDSVENSSDEFYVSHQYRCLDEYKHYVTRQCGSSGWIPEHVVCHNSIDEYTLLMTCPLTYKTFNGELNNIRICLKISEEEQSWNNICLESGSSLTLNDLNPNDRQMLNKQLDDDNATKNVWLPASKMWFTNSSVGFSNPIRWHLAGIYGTEVSPTGNTFSGSDGCLASNWRSDENVITNCNNEYHHLCLFDQQQPTMLPMTCSQGYKTTRYATFHNICIGIETFPRMDIVDDEYIKESICENIFTINSGFSLNIFRELAREIQLNEDDRCLFKILPNRIKVSKDNWRNESDEVEFVNWSLETTFNERVSGILVAKSNGEWIWDDHGVTCAICFVSNWFSIYSPHFNFSPNKREKTLQLYVNFYQNLWRDDQDYVNGFSCFTFVYKPNVPSRIQSVTFIHEGTTNTDSFYKASNVIDGWYWCTGLAKKTFAAIEVEILFRLIKFAMNVQVSNFQFVDPFFIEDFGYYFRGYISHPYIQVDEVSVILIKENIFHLHVDMWITHHDYLKFEENRLKLSDSLLSSYYVQQKLKDMVNDIKHTRAYPEYHILSYNSTEFCLPLSISELDEINFYGSRYGEYAISIEFCLLPTQLPMTKLCTGDSLLGGVWFEETEIPVEANCSNYLQSNVTQRWHNLVLNISSYEADELVDKMTEIVLDTCPSCLIGADIFYISRIMKYLESDLSTPTISESAVFAVLRLYNRLMMVNDTMAYNAASLNATNVLLNVLDKLLINFATSQMSKDPPIWSFVQSTLATFILYPHVSDVTGVAMASISNESDIKFENYKIHYLHRSKTVTNVLNISNLVIASYLPDALLSNIDNPHLPVIINFFINNVLFQTNIPNGINETQQTLIKSSGKIVSVTLSNRTANLKHSLPIFFTPNKYNEISDVCGYWNYTSWSTNGCVQNNSLATSTIILCECSHLTHFAYLFHGSTHIQNDIKLQIVTIVGCSFSLAGILVIYLTAILFKKWRESNSAKVILQFSTAIGFEMVIVLFANTEKNAMIFTSRENTVACIAVGAITHYFVLSTFSWMLIIAYMQFMRYVIVFHFFSLYFVTKASSLGWGIPLIIVTLVLSINRNAYVPTADMYTICYPSGYALYFSVITPIVLITLANLLVFGLVVKALVGKNGNIRSYYGKSLILSQLRLFIFLFFLLGLTWIFAFLSMGEWGLIFSYLFGLTSTMQGFILFFYFIILDPISRGLWTDFLFNKN